MSNETLESLVVMTGKIINGEPAKRCTDSSQPVFINERKVLGSIVNSCQIIVHALTCPVTANLLTPF